jgi:CofD-related protein of GAK system
MLLQIKKTIPFPNKINLARFQKSPELGPKILFFSGGSALRNACNELVKYTHNSIHIVTPFDSGGSSAELRKAFKMPAIGDIRNRLLALADKSVQGYPEIYSLFNYRFPKKGNQQNLQAELDSMISGKHDLVKTIPDPMRKIIRQHLGLFNRKKPDTFNLKNASIGNLILTAGYLHNNRNFDVIIYIFSSLVKVQGIVRPVVNKNLDLAVELEDGSTIVSQHRFSGKESSAIESKITSMVLSEDPEKAVLTSIPIREKMKQLIQQAELICYPMGSFYSSILANLLPKGVGSAISKNPCPKIMIPNTTSDPETKGMTLDDQVQQLMAFLRKDNPDKIAASDVLNFILLDSNQELYPGKFDPKKYAKNGIDTINCRLVNGSGQQTIDESNLTEAILSFV